MPSLNYSSYYQSLGDWLKTPLGEAVGYEFAKAVHSFENQLRGEVLIQIGGGERNPWLDHCNYKHTWIASPTALSVANEIRCSLSQLPIDRDAADAVALPLALEPHKDCQVLLDEVDRILKPMGFVIIFGINPWSLWGASVKAGVLSGFHSSNLSLHTPYGLSRLLLNKGYRQCALTHFCYLPPLKNPAYLHRLEFLNVVGSMLWPFPSGFYCMIFQKYEPAHPHLIPVSAAIAAKDAEDSFLPVPGN